MGRLFPGKAAPVLRTIDFLVVGLGNPGPEYALTRHNFGFMLVDNLRETLDPAGSFRYDSAIRSEIAIVELGGCLLGLVKPRTFMNRSGEAVAAVVELSGLATEKVLVAHDDLDLPLGRIRLRERGGSGGHNGIGSIIAKLGSEFFWRLRLGIGSPERGADTVAFVLSPFAADELPVVSGVLDRARQGLELFLTAGRSAAMNFLNRPQPSGSQPAEG